jgi:hypothetical protein
MRLQVTAAALILLVMGCSTGPRPVTTTRAVGLVSDEDKEFVDAVYTRLTVELAHRKRQSEAHVEELRKDERWATRAVENAAAARRDAQDRLHSVEQAELNYGSPDHVKSSTLIAAEKTLQDATRQEYEARIRQVDTLKAIAEAQRQAAEREQRDRARHTRIKELRGQFFDSLSAGLNQAAERLLAELEDLTGDTVADWNIRITVTWRSSPVNRDALLYYQTKRGRERGDSAVSLGNPTETTESLPMGRYYIWATRKGYCTSDVNRLMAIIKDKEIRTIIEDRSIIGSNGKCPGT